MEDVGLQGGVPENCSDEVEGPLCDVAEVPASVIALGIGKC